MFCSAMKVKIEIFIWFNVWQSTADFPESILLLHFFTSSGEELGIFEFLIDVPRKMKVLFRCRSDVHSSSVCPE